MSAFYGRYYPVSETLWSANWDYNWTVFWMRGGNDSVTTPSTGRPYFFNGGTGNDYFLGDTANDYAEGGSGKDELYGYYGHDSLWGQSGNDKLYGGNGNDTLNGGTGYDILRGGNGTDTLNGDGGNDRLIGGNGEDHLIGGRDGSNDYFVISLGTSDVSHSADVIYDWNRRYDYIDSSRSGNAQNYAEAATTATSLVGAAFEADRTMAGKTHAFLYDSRTDTGYLLSDLNGNNIFETGVIIKGAGSASNMSWADIV